MEKYQFVQDIGSGSFGVASLMWNKEKREFVAVKFIERGSNIDENVAREILNLRSLRHPNIVSFKEVILTQTHLGIVMEFVAGGRLFERINRAGRFGEDEARYFFQQLISGVSYCHSMQICHRDLKPENILLDGSPALLLKICDFGCSKSFLLYSRAKSRVGTLVYTAPEVLSGQEYDAKLADVWSCGVILYVMLVGAYPSQDQNIGFNYKILENLHISRDCRHLLAWILVPNPSKRLAIKDIKRHPWFLKKLPRCLTEEAQATYYRRDNTAFSLQSVDEIMKIVREATGDASV